MNAIREQSRNPVVIGLVAFIIGAIFGLVILGWWLWPVQWVDAPPSALSFDAKVEYLRMAIESYGLNNDTAKAQEHYAALGADADEALNAITQDPGTTNVQLINSFSEVVASVPVSPSETTGGGIRSLLLPLLCVLLLVLAAVVVYFVILRGRSGRGASAPSPAMQAQAAKQQAVYTDFEAEGSEPPLAQFMASYKIGDDLFDDSFSIDSASGEFLGECGVAISETIGVGDPKKVTAFEVWLFDKNDIQTVTKLLMSSHAFSDSAIRQRLEAKGEPVLAMPGAEASLNTETLQLVARVVEMRYGEGALPAESFFDQFILEIAVWPLR